MVELVDARGGLDAVRDEAELVEGAVPIAEVGSEPGGEEAGHVTADDGVAGERTGGGGVGGGGGEALGLLVGLDLAVEGFGGEAAAMGGGGMVEGELVQPLAKKREGGDAKGEEGASEAGAARLAGRVGGEVAGPGGDDAFALGGVVDEAGGEGWPGQVEVGGAGKGVGDGGIGVGVVLPRE